MIKIANRVTSIVSLALFLPFSLFIILSTHNYLIAPGYLYPSIKTINDGVLLIVVVSALLITILVTGIIGIVRRTEKLFVLPIVLIALYIPLSMVFLIFFATATREHAMNACSYTEDVENYGVVDDGWELPSYFPDTIDSDFEVVDYTYYYKDGCDLVDLYLEVKLDDVCTLDEYLDIAKDAMSDYGIVSCVSPYDENYTLLIPERRLWWQLEGGEYSSSILFREKDAKYVFMMFDTVSYSYEELTIIYNFTRLDNHSELGDNPDFGKYYPKYLKRFNVTWDIDNNFNLEYTGD